MKATDERQLAEEKAWGGLPSRNSRVRRRVYWGTAVASLVLIIMILAVILALVVFRIRDPRLSVTSLKVRGVNFKYESGGQKIHVNATLDLRISVRNPNRASFEFRNGTTLLYYAGRMVGMGVVPAGKIPAERTTNLTTVVTIDGDGLLSKANPLSEALSGSLNFSSSTRMTGRVNVLNIYKHHTVSYTFCNFTVAVLEQRIDRQRCIHSIRL